MLNRHLKLYLISESSNQSKDPGKIFLVSSFPYKELFCGFPSILPCLLWLRTSLSVSALTVCNVSSLTAGLCKAQDCRDLSIPEHQGRSLHLGTAHLAALARTLNH